MDGGGIDKYYQLRDGLREEMVVVTIVGGRMGRALEVEMG